MLGALLMAVIAVFPKYSVPRPRDIPFPEDANPFFFGHAASVTEARYKERIAQAFADDVSLYNALITDVYQQGFYLQHSKYRYLKASYSLLIVGFAAAPIVQGISVAT